MLRYPNNFYKDCWSEKKKKNMPYSEISNIVGLVGSARCI